MDASARSGCARSSAAPAVRSMSSSASKAHCSSSSPASSTTMSRSWRWRMDSNARRSLERLFAAFNRRDLAEITELCDERMEFFAVTAEEIGRHDPYVGSEGLRTYLDDVARIWEELLITPREFEQDGNALLVR